MSDLIKQSELSRYELELQVKELKAQLAELDDVNEKLITEKRSCRLLEEENVRLASKAPAGVPQPRALVLIQENKDLSNALSSAKKEFLSEKAKLQSEIDALRADAEKSRIMHSKTQKELEHARAQVVENQRLFDAANATLSSLKASWAQEREEYVNKIDELVNTSKKKDTIRHGEANIRGRNDVTLQEKLLREEVDDLEAKLKASQQQLWEKEKEWLRKEQTLKEQLQEASEQEDKSNSTVYYALQSQIAALKNELSAAQRQRRSSRAFAAISVDTMSAPSEDPSVRRAASPVPAERPAQLSAGPAAQQPAQPESNKGEVDALNGRLEECKKQIRQLQAETDEKEIRLQELQVSLTKAKQQLKLAPPSSTRKPTDEVAAVAAANAENATLKKELRDANSALNQQKALSDQASTVHAAKLKEYRKRVDELTRSNDDLRARLASSEERMAASEAAVVEAQAAAEAASVAALGAETAKPNGEHVVRLVKDKRDCVEDVMRLLELSWDGDDDTKRELARAKHQIMLLLNQLAEKDEEARLARQALDELDEKLKEAAGERDRLRDELKRAQADADGLEKEIDQLHDQVSDLLSEGDRLRDDLGKLEKENADLKSKVKAQKGEKADLLKKMDDLNDECGQLQRQLDDASRRNSTPPPVQPRGDTTGQASQPWSQSPQRPTQQQQQQSRLPIELSPCPSEDDRGRGVATEGAHFAVTIVELADLMRNGKPITEPGYVTIKLKSIKEKYKTSILEFSSVIRFDETFTFYLAQPDQDVITLHVFYKPKNGSREYHIGDSCFSMATLHRGITRQRIAPVVQNPGTKSARRSALIEVALQTDDFGKMTVPTAAEVERETTNFNELVRKFQTSAPEKLHAVDVYAASRELSA